MSPLEDEVSGDADEPGKDEGDSSKKGECRPTRQGDIGEPQEEGTGSLACDDADNGQASQNEERDENSATVATNGHGNRVADEQPHKRARQDERG